MDNTFYFPQRVYEALSYLDAQSQAHLYSAICEYCFTGFDLESFDICTLDVGYERALFLLIMPLLNRANFKPE